MIKASKPAFAILGITAAIGIGLSIAGVEPVSALSGVATGSLRALLAFPLFWTIVGGSLLALAMALKSRSFSGGKVDAIPAMALLTGPLAALACQILAPLIAHDVISKGDANLVFVAAIATFYLVVGNVIGIAPYESKMGLRNRWTLSDPKVWRRTHRFLGRNLVIATLISTPLSLILVPANAQWIVLGAAFLVKAATYLYARSIALNLRSSAPRQASS